MHSLVPKAGPRQEIIVVTGASTGIETAIDRELARRGFHVLAGLCQDADALRAPNLEPVMLDITNEASITALVQRLWEDPVRRLLRALVNNAGLQPANQCAHRNASPGRVAPAIRRQPLRP